MKNVTIKQILYQHKQTFGGYQILDAFQRKWKIYSKIDKEDLNSWVE